jgi:HupE/UreJ protein
VWIGYDHLAFLLLLLLPGVLRAAGASGWQAVPTFRETARDLFRIITAFTLAHSLTLALAATGTVSIPVRPVEIAIAASIVIAGLLNLFPGAARARLALAFGFGLVHGFGFSNALAELGARGARLVPTLAGFNAGVELAQLSLVLLVLPLLFRARKSAFYAWRFMPAASLAAAMAGAAWLVARASV